MYSRNSISKIKRQFNDHYLKGIFNITQLYGIYTIEINSPSKIHGRYLLQRRRRYRSFKSIHRIHMKYTTSKLSKSEFKIH